MASPIFFFNYNTFKRIKRCFKEEKRTCGGNAADRSLKSIIIEEENGRSNLCPENERMGRFLRNNIFKINVKLDTFA